MQRIIFICLLLFLTFGVHAQWRGLRLSSIGPEEGLTMRVNAITQDSSGYLYFGGSQGLVRYDGQKLLSFSNIYGDTSSISPGEIRQLITSQDGRIYIGLRFSGFNRFDPRTNTFERFEFPKIDEEMEYGGESLLEDKKGSIWIGGQRLRLYRFDPSTDSLQSFFPKWLDYEKWNRRLTIQSIIQDKNNADLLWLSVLDYRDPTTQKGSYPYGLFSFNKRTSEFTSHHNIGRIQDQLEDGTIRSTHTMDKIITFSPKTLALRNISITPSLSTSFLSRAITTVGNEEWILTAGEIRAWNTDSTIRQVYVSNDASKMTAFHTDRSGKTWITSWQGVRSIDPEKNQIEYFSLSEFADETRIYPGRLAYHSKTNTILMSHASEMGKNRLYRIPLDKNREADYLETDKNIMGIAVDADDRIWLSDSKDLMHLNGDKFSNNQNIITNEKRFWWHWNMRINEKEIAGVLGLRELLWFDTKGDTLKYILTKNFIHEDGAPNLREELNGFTFDDEDNAIIFNSRIYKVNLLDRQVTHLKYDQTFNPSADYLFDVRIDNQNNYWVSGPSSTGKFRLENDSLILLKAYTVHDGLAESQVTEIHIDHRNRVWCFTGSGINCIDQQSNNIRYFGLNEGLPQIFTDPRQVISLPDDRIATVNNNGLIIFHPDSLWATQNTQSVPVVINNIRINGKNADIKGTANYLKTFTFPKGKNVVDIQFSGLKYPDARQLNYSYRLHGYQDDWIDIGTNRSITLSGLPAGSFDLEVKAGGILDNAPIKKLQLLVPRPLYQQWWFILICAGLAGLVIYTIYQLRVNKIRREEAEITATNKKIAELEMKALRSQMNPHFMFNSLNSIKNFILRSEKKEAAEYLSNFAHLIRMILQNSREKTISLQEELDTLMLYIELEQLRFDDAFEFTCEIDPGIDMNQIFIPPMILQPYIENAIWHGLMHKKSKGILSLIFKKEKGHISCIVQDNGVGRAKALEIKNESIRKYKSMGMGITHDRIQLANKLDSLGISVKVEDLNFHNDGSSGTRVRIKIPQKSVDEN